jgi:hypothetical protein
MCIDSSKIKILAYLMTQPSRRRRYKIPPLLLTRPQLNTTQLNNLTTMQFFKSAVLLALTVATYASASAHRHENHDKHCVALGYACSPDLELNCCPELICAPPGIVSAHPSACFCQIPSRNTHSSWFLVSLILWNHIARLWEHRPDEVRPQILLVLSLLF